MTTISQHFVPANTATRIFITFIIASVSTTVLAANHYNLHPGDAPYWCHGVTGAAGPFSDETGNNVGRCPVRQGLQTLLTGLTCSGRNCDFVTMRCGNPGSATVANDPTQGPRFSEENGGIGRCPNNNGKKNQVVTQIRCQGEYCDNLYLTCQTLTSAQIDPSNCDTTASSAATGSTPSIPPGTFAVGVNCGGPWCAWKQIRYCHTKTPAPLCPGPQLANTLISFQQSSGGWPKNIQFHAGDVYSGPAVSGTLDNDATVNEIRYQAQAYVETNHAAYQQSAMDGLNFILNGQWPTGGWPQSLPLEGGYKDHIMFNDNVHVNVMKLLDEIVAANTPPFNQFPLSSTDRQRVVTAQTKGLQCILNAQIRVPVGFDDTCPTTRRNWCAQHHKDTLAPVAGRNYEPASFSGSEGLMVAHYLMQLDNPNWQVKEAILGTYIWAKQAVLRDYRLQRNSNDWELVYSPGAELWPRFATIPGNQVIFCSRGCTQNAALMENGYPDGFALISQERRVGYTWLGTWGQSLINHFDQWRRNHPDVIVSPACLVRKTASPTSSPTASPTTSPTPSPTASPTKSPTAGPTASPSVSPTASPVISEPLLLITSTSSPTKSPTASPTSSPSDSPVATSSTAMPVAFFNEIHYADDEWSRWENEFFEIAGTAGMNLQGWKVQVYVMSRDNRFVGVGFPYTVINLSGVVVNEASGYGFELVPVSRILNRMGGLCLLDDSGTVVEFVSWEGSFTAAGGLCHENVSSDIGVKEDETTPSHFSMQRKGQGTLGSDFSWAAPSVASPGSVNAGQSFGVTASAMMIPEVKEQIQVTVAATLVQDEELVQHDGIDSTGGTNNNSSSSWARQMPTTALIMLVSLTIILV